MNASLDIHTHHALGFAFNLDPALQYGNNTKDNFQSHYCISNGERSAAAFKAPVFIQSSAVLIIDTQHRESGSVAEWRSSALILPCLRYLILSFQHYVFLYRFMSLLGSFYLCQHLHNETVFSILVGE